MPEQSSLLNFFDISVIVFNAFHPRFTTHSTQYFHFSYTQLLTCDSTDVHIAGLFYSVLLQVLPHSRRLFSLLWHLLSQRIPDNIFNQSACTQRVISNSKFLGTVDYIHVKLFRACRCLPTISTALILVSARHKYSVLVAANFKSSIR